MTAHNPALTAQIPSYIGDLFSALNILNKSKHSMPDNPSYLTNTITALKVQISDTIRTHLTVTGFDIYMDIRDRGYGLCTVQLYLFSDLVLCRDVRTGINGCELPKDFPLYSILNSDTLIYHIYTTPL